jgi:DNA helicase II / ATP-dependent DNA helicase PcrA
MSIDKIEWQAEEKRLEKVLEEIGGDLKNRRRDTKGHLENMKSATRAMWENSPRNPQQSEEMIESAQYQDEIRRSEITYRFSSKQVEKLEKMMESPYFGRIDFQEKGDTSAEKVYIGTASFFNDDTLEMLVYDWRSSIASMFYDFELGPAFYETLDGNVEGEMKLKRQYKIADGKINFMFDSSVKIDDDMLQEMLGKSADDKMKNIVTTIQREQNRIIRDDKHNLLIVQGTAGSGKTSIALHRAAYLLYKYRDKVITSKNIIIFSPNKMFNDYISNVLPELGEENLQQTTFMEYAEGMLRHSYRLDDSSELMEYILSERDYPEYRARIAGVKFKASEEFLKIIENYLEHIEESYSKFEDVTIDGETIVNKEELLNLFRKDYDYLPVVKRLRKINERISYLLEPYREKRLQEIEKEVALDPSITHEDIRYVSKTRLNEELSGIRDRINNMTNLYTFGAYMRLFSDDNLFKKVSEGISLPEEIKDIRRLTFENLNQRMFKYEDISPYLYFKGELEGVEKTGDIRHVIIDEGQDYTPVQYKIFKQLYPDSGMTILGDLNQSINAFANVKGYDRVRAIMDAKTAAILELTKSYRSTSEIIDFTSSMLGGETKIEAVSRHGEKPKVIEGTERNRIDSHIVDDIKNLLKEGMNSIAVICKTAAESRGVYDKLKKHIEIDLIQRDDSRFSRGVVVIPSYLAKGLEFDGVIVYDGSDKRYSREEERKLLYTCCTRALHRLLVYSVGRVSRFIGELDKGLYESREI